jgi:7-keto-8-aminopelargonate synthetase-like enzyme
MVKKSSALLMQDDAHGFGVFAPIIPQNSIYMATLGKAAGTMGAFVAGDACVCSALNVILKRAVSFGTVGGRMALT